MPKIAPSSRSYLLIEGIRAFDPTSPDGSADPTILGIFLSFPLQDQVPTIWYVGQWVNAKMARILLGPPDGIVIPVGVYDIWINVVGSVESPEWKIDELVVSVV